ncbi:MAG: DUF983 domain-containing protein [Flavobacterium sp.]|nr:MAG: DUF983 domain-containing protein [Flavobacterium sp.]
MLKKGSKVYSILTGTCPRCHTDRMYVNPNPYVVGDIMKMHEHCSTCGLRYKIEPNFFFGAMYVSYALAVFISIVIFLVLFLGFHTGLMTAFISIFIGLLLLMPPIVRVSRNIYINMFISYDPQAANRHQND